MRAGVAAVNAGAATMPRGLGYTRRMPAIAIRRSHALSHKKAREAAERIARDLERRFDLAYAWEGDQLRFERPGVHGHIHVGKDEVTLEARLGLLLSPMRGAIEREIHAQLDELFGKPARR